MIRHDVVVVGGRVAGASTALLLARAGVRVTGTAPIRQVIFHYADGEQAVVAIRPSAGVDALYAPRRYLFDQLLVDARGSRRRRGAA